MVWDEVENILALLLSDKCVVHVEDQLLHTCKFCLLWPIEVTQVEDRRCLWFTKHEEEFVKAVSNALF